MADEHVPSLKELLCLTIPDLVEPSPKGTKVAYTTIKTNWRDNRYERECFVYDAQTKQTHKITDALTISNFRWLNENTLTMLKSISSGRKEEEKLQIWVYENLIGDGIRMTLQKTGVQSFEPFSDGFVYMADNPEKKNKKKRNREFGTLVHIEEEEGETDLYYVSVPHVEKYRKQVRSCTEEEEKKLVKPFVNLTEFHKIVEKIESFVISPKYDAIYINTRKKTDLIFLEDSKIFKLDIDIETVFNEYLLKEEKKLESKEEETKDKKKEEEFICGDLAHLNLPKGARIRTTSPNGNILLISHKERDNYFYTQGDLWLLDLSLLSKENLCNSDLSNSLTCITKSLDQSIMTLNWNIHGIFVSYFEESTGKLAKINNNYQIDEIDLDGSYLSYGFSASKGGFISFIGTNKSEFMEIFVLSAEDDIWKMEQISHFSEQIQNWKLGQVESIKWKSKDDTEIEGVLIKPPNFDETKKYPLALIVHGGPSWVSRSYLVEGGDLRYYPVIQFVNKDIVILKPNYRGSIGRGQSFLELNKDNLGIGDLWDIESGVEHLVKKGYINENKVGCMGWSQGGYISAFATTHSDKFAAVSVGAGISSWHTYHIGTDIRQFTHHYLSSLPHENRVIYEKTAAMSKITEAKTPTLIQHGENDNRVPLLNATELYRGLKYQGVPVEFFMYPGMPHGINKPRENHAILSQNLKWFSHYLLGEELDFFSDNQEESS